MLARLTVEAGAVSPPLLDISPDISTIKLGRSQNNIIVLQDKHASRSHAEISFFNGAWHLRDCDTINGTKLDGNRIQGTVRLHNGQVIGIGDTRIRFVLDPSKVSTATVPALMPAEEPRLVSLPPANLNASLLHPDELTALLLFMNASLDETTPHGLVTLALQTVQAQTQASFCGFLSFDETEDIQMKVMLPAEAKVNASLSRQLTLKVRREGNSAWLGGSMPDGSDLESESLAAYCDAICVPLRRNLAADSAVPGQTGGGRGPLGALHAYKSNGSFNERDVRFCEVLAGYLTNMLHILRSRRALAADNTRLREHTGSVHDKLIGDSQVMEQLRAQIALVANHPSTVLIEGESGVGKELVARALHRLSPRCDGPLNTVNCGSLTNNVTEAELFGYEKGAFTGADQAHPGLFQEADEGTLFLDEIGELSRETQARLLRVLETKSVRPLMAKAEIKVDVRIIAATNRDLEKEVRQNRFRHDLFFRLGTRIRVPPLREHLEDIPALADHFLNILNTTSHRHVRLSPEALRRLQAYPWPGNVRQLKSVLETAAMMTPGDVLQASDLRLDAELQNLPEGVPSLNLEELEAWAIRQALMQTNGVQVQAAKILGIHRETLINKMKKYNIERMSAGTLKEEGPGGI